MFHLIRHSKSSQQFDGDVQLYEWVASGTVVMLKLKQQMVRMGQ